MENNKIYLQRIHWAAIIALAGYLLLWLVLKGSLIQIRDISTFVDVSAIVFPFAALGTVKNKWREAIIACIVALAIYFIDQRIAGTIGRTDLLIFLRFLLDPFPVLLLVALQTGWRKVGIVYLLCMIADSLGFGQYTANPVMITREIGINNINSSLFIHFAYYIGAFVAHVIFICEIINYANGKAMVDKPRLLNLGNIYPKYNSLLACWCIKSALWYLIGGGFMVIGKYVETFQQNGHTSGDFYSDFAVVDPTLLYKISSLIYLLSWVAAAMLLA